MSVKHVEDYYNQICEQYKELQENLRDAENDLAENLVTPEYVDNLRNMIEPFKVNYGRLTYIMFLLHMPQRKDKQDKYTKQNKKLLKSIGDNSTDTSVLKENAEIIKNVRHCR